MSDEKDLVKAGVEGAVSGAIEGSGFRDLVQRFLGPLATEVGTGLGYVGTVLRMKLALSMMQKASKILSDAGIDPKPVAPKLFLPILEHASLEDDEYLQERWATLLANVAGSGGKVVVACAFPGILKELSSEEARILTKMYEGLKEEFARSESPALPLRTPLGTHSRVFAWYCQEFHGKRVADPRSIVQEELYPGFCAIIDNLKRLGLLFEHLVPLEYQLNPDRHFLAASPSTDIQTIITGEHEERIFMTELGYQFVRACQPPISGGNS